jgi:hypothetical protein
MTRRIEVDFSGTSPSRGVKIPPGWWPVRGGGFIPIRDMTLAHLQAALNRLSPNHPSYHELRAELTGRELEIAQRVMNEQRPKPIDIVELERKRRQQLDYSTWVDSMRTMARWGQRLRGLGEDEIGAEIDKALEPVAEEPKKKKVSIIRREKK